MLGKLQQEVDQVGEEESSLDEYIKEMNLKVSPKDKNSVGPYATTSINGYDIKIVLPDVEDEEPAQEEEQEEEEKQQGESDEARFERDRNFYVILKPTGKEGPCLQVQCISGKRGPHLMLEGFFFGDNMAQLEPSSEEDFEKNGEPEFLHYDALTDDVQDKIADLFDVIKIDDDLAMFVQLMGLRTARKETSARLSRLSKFFDA